MKPMISTKKIQDEDLEQVIVDISPILNSLPIGMMVMAENLFPWDMWESTDNTLHRTLGQALSFLVSQGRLRLKALPDKLDGIKRYLVL